jgi:uncharacterized pyridoxal phosphate-containing UPF0001 family protein
VTLIAVSRRSMPPQLRRSSRPDSAYSAKIACGSQGEVARVNVGLSDIALHLIGAATNKAREAVALFDAIHSVDRPSICEALARKSFLKTPAASSFSSIPARSRRGGRRSSRGGCLHCQLPRKYRLPISGLMCIPPVDDAPAPHRADREDRHATG